MPSKDRIAAAYRALLDAALEQPRPTAELRQALAQVMSMIDHSLLRESKQEL